MIVKGGIAMLHHFLELVIPEIAAALELIGVFVIVLSGIKALIRLSKRGFYFGDESIKVDLAQALALSLEFKLAGEILKTIIIRTIDEFLILAAIVILRVILTFLIHWEIKDGEEVIKHKKRVLKENNDDKVK